MDIQRIYHNIADYLKPSKVLVLYGPRRVGKTTLIEHFLQSTSQLKYRFESGDNIMIQNILGSGDFELLKEFASGYDLLAIDEAQKIKNIGNGLKILIDHVPNLKIIATGSSSFELAGQIGEPLTGRKITLTLFPISQLELIKNYNRFDIKQKLEEYLIYGSYPEVITTVHKKEKAKILMELLHSYLLKDILELDGIKNSRILLDLIRLLAFQIGSEVSLSELGSKLGIDKKTVARYLDLLEKSFVIYNLRGFSRNLRNEVTKKSKYYFYDIGVRNAIIANFNSLDLRNDIGQLWENFLLMERIKKQNYEDMIVNDYFWRTWEQKEIDLIEEREGVLYGYEFKWRETHSKSKNTWLNAYANAHFAIINNENYLDFVG